MQPNDQQGYYQPEQPQPVQPAVPQPEAQPVNPVGATAVEATVTAPPQQAPQAPAEQQFDDVYDDEGAELSDDAQVTWSAQEYIHQEKGAMWFVAFAVIIVAMIAVSIFLMSSWLFAVLLAVIAVAVVVNSKRPPRELAYAITNDGLYIDNKLHKFEMFKSFGVIHDGLEFSVMLIPTQRFQPGVSVYFPEQLGEDIVDMLGSRLPMKDLKMNAVDRIVRLLRL